MAGETTSVAASAARTFAQNPGAGAYWVFFNLTYSTTQNELNDVMQAGYIAPNTRVIQTYWGPTDMDTNVSPAAVHKITVNAVDAVTGLTGAQSGTSAISAVTSTFAATAPGTSAQLVLVTTTTAAATAAAGTAVLGLLCQAN
jgi:hypothetical protein